MLALTLTMLMTNVDVSLKDEIDLEKAKIVKYEEALKLSKETQKPLVCMVGCYGDDVALFNSLKGKVILCYLQANSQPFQTVKEGVIVGLWENSAGNLVCNRTDVAAITFRDNYEKYLTSTPKTFQPFQNGQWICGPNGCYRSK